MPLVTDMLSKFKLLLSSSTYSRIQFLKLTQYIHNIWDTELEYKYY